MHWSSFVEHDARFDTVLSIDQVIIQHRAADAATLRKAGASISKDKLEPKAP